MFTFLYSFLNYFTKAKEVDEDKDKENFLAEQLVELEALAEKEKIETVELATPELPRNAVCFQKTGIITDMGEDYVLIDGMFYFNLMSCSLTLNINDKVLYLGYKDENESVFVARILQNQGMTWGEEEEAEENSFIVTEHVIVGEVIDRQDRFVCIKDSDLKFNLDDVKGSFVPMKGDWLEIMCTIQFDENKPSDISMSQVLQVISFKPLRRRIKSATITYWNGEYGICDKQIYFNKHCLDTCCQIIVGTKVMVEAIESNQEMCTWRALKLILKENYILEPELPQQPKEEESSLDLEKEKNIDFTYPIEFENVDINSFEKTTATITNNSDETYVIKKWLILSKKRDSQINVKPFLIRPTKLFPKQSFTLSIECCPKFLGIAKECFIILFRGFQLKRFINVNITSKDFLPKQYESRFGMKNDNINLMRNLRSNNDRVVPGIRPSKAPNFVPVKLGMFTVPDKIWSAVLGDSDQTIFASDYYKILRRIETNLPCLAQDLNIGNYIDKWHTLLYMEEIQANIHIRMYDMSKAFLIRCQEYLALEISGLSERRPSLIKGDKVIVKDVWDSSSTKYEGFIHNIKGDFIMMKFSPHFHDIYSGGDVSVEFHFSRSIFRRAHQAINLALSNLGPDILFPNKIVTRCLQVPPERLKSISWFNEKLNKEQKSAVTNILMGECMIPYCIFGPPGTGKTVTVIETILQILYHFPDSRILVATPSNSAANLITERLIDHRNNFSDSMIRLVANYLVDSDTIPDIIKPFCATLDIASERTRQSKYNVKDGVNLNCQTSFIGRHRVTIGTCYCIGTLAMMGLPQGHFTHVIVDEAGQATEPEIMIPLTFIDKRNGQIILAGDPMQLGPVIMSKYCKEFGMDESYMSRILETFPYQKDYDAYANGFNKKLVTQLTDNYRSLEQVLKLPNKMFYGSSLEAKLDKSQSWVGKTLEVISELFDTSYQTSGGIYVYGIRGCNTRAEDSPSWYNLQEASMLALTTCKLFKKGLDSDDIGIVTPYVAQIKHLRLLFDSMGLTQPKIGTVEEFQGQERLVILISTVRSTESLLEDDYKHKLGFVNNPKRLNVALTRAKIAVILFCDPHLLCKDSLWSQVIGQAVREDKYMGCDLPYGYQNNLEEMNK